MQEDHTDLKPKRTPHNERHIELNGHRSFYATDEEAEDSDTEDPLHFPANGLFYTIIIGIIAGVLSVAISIGIAYLSAPVFQQEAQAGKAVTSSTYIVAFVIPGVSFLISMLICFFSGFTVGKLAVRRQLGFLVGVIIGVLIYLGGFITRYIPGYPGNLNSTSSGPNTGATIGVIGLLLIFLMFWSMISGLVSLWGARVATRRHPHYQLP